MIDTQFATLDLTVATEAAAFAFCRAHDWAIEIGRDDDWTPATKWTEVTHHWAALERAGCQPRLRSIGAPGNDLIDLEPLAIAEPHPALTSTRLARADYTTPEAVFLDDVATETLRGASLAAASLSTSDLEVVIAYSAKTNPDPRMLELAREHGLHIEAISQHEVAAALAAGYHEDEIVLNGPAKWWPESATRGPVHAVFCDSLEEFAALQQQPGAPASIVGVRLRPPSAVSRFGIELSNAHSRTRLLELLGTMPETWTLGCHFHIQSSVIGTHSWWQAFASMLEEIARLSSESGRDVACLDIGGGWDPADWRGFLDRLPLAVRAIREALPAARELIIEPGKALAQPSAATVMTVLEVRRDLDGTVHEVVVDGSVAEVPQFYNYPHPIALRATAEQTPGWRPLSRGNASILGRLCMEKDIIATHLDIPPDIEAGDLIVVLDTGAYDRSTAYSFGLGNVADAPVPIGADRAH
jgi:diaminopimelate decarboxylase